MFGKLCILLIFSKLKMLNHLIYNYLTHNLYTIFAKFLDICKQIAGNLVNEHGNILHLGAVWRFSDWEVITLNMTSEAMGIDSESFFFFQLQEYKGKIPNLISRQQYNEKRKSTTPFCKIIRERIAKEIDGERTISG